MNKENNTLSNVGDVITQKPVRIEITVKPKNFLQRLLIRIRCISNKRVFELSPIVVGNMYRIASKVVLIPDNILEKSVHWVISHGIFAHKDHIIYMIACGLQNNYREPSKELLELIEFEFTAEDLATVYDHILVQMNAKAFIKSIVLMKGLNVLNVPELDVQSAKVPE